MMRCGCEVGAKFDRIETGISKIQDSDRKWCSHDEGSENWGGNGKESDSFAPDTSPKASSGLGRGGPEGIGSVEVWATQPSTF
jgi:hypothetical protein